MTNQRTVDKIMQYVKSKQFGSGCHDWWHIYRVWKTSKIIGKKENADMIVIQLAAFLHDLADWKFHGEASQIREAENILRKFNVDNKTSKYVIEIISNISFKGMNAKNRMKTIEGKVVQDADRLDALGAMGIARCFAYGGNKGMMIHDPTKQIKKNITKKEYMKSASGAGTSIENFHQKLLLLKYIMNTKTGKKIAERRHKFMQTYMNEFYKEWNMEDIK